MSCMVMRSAKICNGIIDGQTDISSAQIEYRGEQAGDRLGSMMSAVRDVDGDGYADFLVGSPESDTGVGAGKVLFSVVSI